ncbi:MAG: glutamate--tRNA ligase, partial [Propionibacteriales bacterium]
DDDSEVATFDEFVEHFDWNKVNTTGPIFDLKKLDWLNGYYIRSLSADELTSRVIDFHRERGDWDESIDVSVFSAAMPLVQERMVLLGDALPKLQFLFVSDVVVDEKARAALADNAGEVLGAAVDVLSGLSDWKTDEIHSALRTQLVEEMGIKPRLAFAPLRVAISGAKVSPPLFESMEILGREETLRRLRGFSL